MQAEMSETAGNNTAGANRLKVAQVAKIALISEYLLRNSGNTTTN